MIVSTLNFEAVRGGGGYRHKTHTQKHARIKKIPLMTNFLFSLTYFTEHRRNLPREAIESKGMGIHPLINTSISNETYGNL